MVKRERTAGNLELVGGRLCLDFANTVSTRIKELGREYLVSYEELVAWSWHAGILTDDEADDLLHSATLQPALASATLDQAITLRETIYRIFAAIADRREPEKVDFVTLNAALHEALAWLEIVPSPGGFTWAWVLDRNSLDRILWPIVRSTAELLTSEDLKNVHACAGEGCDWLFVDSSKNHSRRWCSMNACGSRVKAQRYYRRRKQKNRGQR